MTSGLYQIPKNLIAVYKDGLNALLGVGHFGAEPFHPLFEECFVSAAPLWVWLSHRVRKCIFGECRISFIMELLGFLMLQVPYYAAGIGILGIYSLKRVLQEGRDELKPLSPTGGFIYTYAYHQDEKDLCQLEMRAFFGTDTGGKVIKSSRGIAPGRSPFIKERIELLFEGGEFADIVKQAEKLDMENSTFKVIFPKINGLDAAEQVDFEEKRDMERQIGFVIKGKADVHNPDIIFGLIPFDGRWHFGIYQLSKSVWFKHQQKPREYSTALSTKTARAIANIAVPEPTGIKAIDPCCGIGTVLVEALSMGIDIVGRDINPLVVDGSRENIAHFGLSGSVDLGAIADITEQYDVAIIDMPYNLYTHATPDEQQEILKHALPVTEKLLVVTIDPIDHMIENAGFTITDRCIAKKSLFLREILVCEKTEMPHFSSQDFQKTKIKARP